MTGNIERVPLLEQHCAYWAQWEPWPVVRRDSVSKNSYFIIRSNRDFEYKLHFRVFQPDKFKDNINSND